MQVRAAIHVKSVDEMKNMYGEVRSRRGGYAWQWGECGMKNVEYERGATSTLLPRFPAIIERYRVLIFSGDVDACVPYVHARSSLRSRFKLMCAQVTMTTNASVVMSLSADYVPFRPLIC